MYSNEEIQSRIKRQIAETGFKLPKLNVFVNDLGLPAEYKTVVRRILKKMVGAGNIRVNSKIELKKEQTDINIKIGTFSRSFAGSGFVRPLGADSKTLDIFIPQHSVKDAASGDTVAVEIYKEKNRSFRHEGPNRGPRGKIVRIEKRANTIFVGSYFEVENWGYVQIDGSRFPQPISVGDTNCTPKVGDKIVVEMLQFPSEYRDGEAKIVEILGSHKTSGVDTLLIMREYSLPDEFSPETLEAAQEAVQHYASESDANRYDATGELTITIDPIDARDFDDAISLSKLPNGHWRLGVHIADVSHFVPKDSPLDREARDRGTSVYFPDRVVPMLPEAISNSIASLQEGKKRYAKSVYMEFTPKGVRTHTEIQKSVIVNDARLNYDEVELFFGGQASSLSRPHANRNDGRGMYRLEACTPENSDAVCQLLRELRKLASVLRDRRISRGAIELSREEPEIEIDENGRVIGARVRPNGESNRMIEAFMLAANDAIAEYFADRNLPVLRRIHPYPSYAKIKDFADFVRSLRIAAIQPDALYESRFEIQKLLKHVEGRQEEAAVNFALLRSMQKAVYSPEKEGHYALASDCYCHFTSPIRRYPDLIVHRMLDALLLGEKPKADFNELVRLGEHCSERERRAENAERELVKLKLIELMSRRIGQMMKARVTGIKPFGIFVCGTEIPAEGLLRLNSLTDDHYYYDKKSQSLIGHRMGNSIRLGDRIDVRIVKANIDTREIDFVKR